MTMMAEIAQIVRSRHFFLRPMSANANYFDNLLSLIPAQYYYNKEERVDELGEDLLKDPMGKKLRRDPFGGHRLDPSHRKFSAKDFQERLAVAKKLVASSNTPTNSNDSTRSQQNANDNSNGMQLDRGGRFDRRRSRCCDEQCVDDTGDDEIEQEQ
jgi:hypothetical protein